MTDKYQISDNALEALFEEARATPPEPSADLMARVLADAQAERPAARSAGWRGLWGRFGNLPALGGLVTATCVGFWLGVAPPAVVPDLAGQMLGTEITEDAAWDTPSVNGFGWDIGEG